MYAGQVDVDVESRIHHTKSTSQKRTGIVSCREEITLSISVLEEIPGGETTRKEEKEKRETSVQRSTSLHMVCGKISVTTHGVWTMAVNGKQESLATIGRQVWTLLDSRGDAAMTSLCSNRLDAWCSAVEREET